MSKTKLLTFYVEGPDWEHVVTLDPDVFDDERSQLIEAATVAIQKQMEIAGILNVGAVMLVKKSKAAKKEAMVNSYLCMINAAQYTLAEVLRQNFMRETGQDLAVDTNGYSY